MATGFLRAGSSPGPELTPLLESVTRAEALCHRTALLEDSPELTWCFLSQQFTRSASDFLRQPNTTALAKQNAKYEWTEGRGRSAFKLCGPILPSMEKVLSENSGHQFDEVREQIFSGLESKESGVWSSDWKEWICYPIICSSSQGWVGSRDLAYFSSGRVASLSKFSKALQNHHRDHFACSEYLSPFPQTPGTGSNIYPGFPRCPHPHTRSGEDQSTGNGRKSRGKHYPHNMEYL